MSVCTAGVLRVLRNLIGLIRVDEDKKAEVTSELLVSLKYFSCNLETLVSLYSNEHSADEVYGDLDGTTLRKLLADWLKQLLPLFIKFLGLVVCVAKENIHPRSGRDDGGYLWCFAVAESLNCFVLCLIVCMKFAFAPSTRGDEPTLAPFTHLPMQVIQTKLYELISRTRLAQTQVGYGEVETAISSIRVVSFQLLQQLLETSGNVYFYHYSRFNAKICNEILLGEIGNPACAEIPVGDFVDFEVDCCTSFAFTSLNFAVSLLEQLIQFTSEYDHLVAQRCAFFLKFYILHTGEDEEEVFGSAEDAWLRVLHVLLSRWKSDGKTISELPNKSRVFDEKQRSPDSLFCGHILCSLSIIVSRLLLLCLRAEALNSDVTRNVTTVFDTVLIAYELRILPIPFRGNDKEEDADILSGCLSVLQKLCLRLTGNVGDILELSLMLCKGVSMQLMMWKRQPPPLPLSVVALATTAAPTIPMSGESACVLQTSKSRLFIRAFIVACIRCSVALAEPYRDHKRPRLRSPCAIDDKGVRAQRSLLLSLWQLLCALILPPLQSSSSAGIQYESLCYPVFSDMVQSTADKIRTTHESDLLLTIYDASMSMLSRILSLGRKETSDLFFDCILFLLFAVDSSANCEYALSLLLGITSNSGESSMASLLSLRGLNCALCLCENPTKTLGSINYMDVSAQYQCHRFLSMAASVTSGCVGGVKECAAFSFFTLLASGVVFGRTEKSFLECNVALLAFRSYQDLTDLGSFVSKEAMISYWHSFTIAEVRRDMVLGFVGSGMHVVSSRVIAPCSSFHDVKGSDMESMSNITALCVCGLQELSRISLSYPPVIRRRLEELCRSASVVASSIMRARASSGRSVTSRTASLVSHILRSLALLCVLLTQQSCGSAGEAAPSYLLPIGSDPMHIQGSSREQTWGSNGAPDNNHTQTDLVRRILGVAAQAFDMHRYDEMEAVGAAALNVVIGVGSICVAMCDCGGLSLQWLRVWHRMDPTRHGRSNSSIISLSLLSIACTLRTRWVPLSKNDTVRGYPNNDSDNCEEAKSSSSCGDQHTAEISTLSAFISSCSIQAMTCWVSVRRNESKPSQDGDDSMMLTELLSLGFLAHIAFSYLSFQLSDYAGDNSHHQSAPRLLSSHAVRSDDGGTKLLQAVALSCVEHTMMIARDEEQNAKKKEGSIRVVSKCTRKCLQNFLCIDVVCNDFIPKTWKALLSGYLPKVLHKYEEEDDMNDDYPGSYCVLNPKTDNEDAEIRGLTSAGCAFDIELVFTNALGVLSSGRKS